LIRRDRLTMALALAAITMLAWMYLLSAGATMKSMATEAQMHAAMGMTDMGVSSTADWLALFVMWTIMMAGMMLPSAAPVILLVLAGYRRRGGRHARASAGAFVTGYLVAWTSFSAVAATAQVVLHRAALLSAEMTSRSAVLAGAILIAAGIYQWLPIKKACLSHCQSPLEFLTRHWREGFAGAFTMGLRHGMFCIGCCWAMMALLFVVGVMNVWWIAALAAFVLIEKLAPREFPVGRAAGFILILWGTYEVLA
jgi:predicted metal-binding membrane protein